MIIKEYNLPLAAIICGFENGGTTVLTELLRCHPLLDAGFEGGFLLKRTPWHFIGFEPYYTHLKAGWGITEEEAQFICHADTWPEVYQRLLAKSRKIKNSHSLTFDKTPRYMLKLKSVLKKTPNVPCLVLLREAKATIWAWKKRMPQLTIQKACRRYNSYMRGLRRALKSRFKHRIMIIQYENLCTQTEIELSEIFKFLQLSFPDMPSTFNPSFPGNVHDKTINSYYINEFKSHLSDSDCLYIAKHIIKLKK